MKELGIDGYGAYNVVAGFVTMMGFWGTTMITGLQRFYNYEIGKRGEISSIEVYSAGIKIQLMLSVIILVIFESIGLWYVNNIMKMPAGRLSEINWLYQFSIISMLMNIMTVPYVAFVISKEKMDVYAFISVFECIAKLVSACSLSLILSDKLYFYGLFLMIVSILNFCGYYSYCKRAFSWLKFRHLKNRNLIKEILSFSGWNSISAFANIGRGQGVNLLLNYFFGVSINAANAIVTQIYSAVQTFALNICTAFRPQFVESYAKENSGRTLSLFYNMSKWSYVMVYIMCVPIYLELLYILNIWLGKEIPQYTDIFTIITLLIILIGSLNTPISIAIYANGKIRDYILLYSCICFCIPLGWIGFHFGAEPYFVFWVTLVLMVIIQIFSMILLKKYLPYSYKDYMNNVIIPILIFTFVFPILPVWTHYVINNATLRFFAVFLSTIVSSAAAIYLIILDINQRRLVYRKIMCILRI